MSAVPEVATDREIFATAMSTQLQELAIGEDLLDRYANTEHGLHHAAQPLRYEAPFGCYDREQMLADLGSDVHPVGHMHVTHRTFLATLAMET